jgi:hypothetical protein
MSNHFHLVVELVPDEAATWSDSEIAHRWVRLFPVGGVTAETDELRIQALLANPERLALVRGRLCDLGWFMRCLDEPIARRANREDQCKGRFWEGRYKAQALLDERAVLAAMAYVDLNPIRAGVTDRLELSTAESGHPRRGIWTPTKLESADAPSRRSETGVRVQFPAPTHETVL